MIAVSFFHLELILCGFEKNSSGPSALRNRLESCNFTVVPSRNWSTVVHRCKTRNDLNWILWFIQGKSCIWCLFVGMLNVQMEFYLVGCQLCWCFTRSCMTQTCRIYFPKPLTHPGCVLEIIQWWHNSTKLHGLLIILYYLMILFGHRNFTSVSKTLRVKPQPPNWVRYWSVIPQLSLSSHAEIFSWLGLTEHDLFDVQLNLY